MTAPTVDCWAAPPIRRLAGDHARSAGVPSLARFRRAHGLRTGRVAGCIRRARECPRARGVDEVRDSPADRCALAARAGLKTYRAERPDISYVSALKAGQVTGMATRITRGPPTHLNFARPARGDRLTAPARPRPRLWVAVAAGVGVSVPASRPRRVRGQLKPARAHPVNCTFSAGDVARCWGMARATALTCSGSNRRPNG